MLLCAEIYKQIRLTTAYGSYVFWHFPWQLCSLPMFLAPALLFLKDINKKDAVFAFLASFGLLGGIAVFFDPSGLQYVQKELTVLSYAWHISMILFGLYAFSGIRGNINTGFRKACILYLSGCLIAVVLNLLLDRYGEIDLFYINPLHNMSQIVFRDLVPLFGNLPTILFYILMTILGAAILFYLNGELHEKVHDDQIDQGRAEDTDEVVFAEPVADDRESAADELRDPEGRG